MASNVIPQADEALLEAQAMAGPAGVEAYDAARARMEKDNAAAYQSAGDAAVSRGGPASAMQSALAGARDIGNDRMASVTAARERAAASAANRESRLATYEGGVQGARSLIKDEAYLAAAPIRAKGEFDVNRIQRQGEQNVAGIEANTALQMAQAEAAFRANEQAARIDQERWEREMAQRERLARSSGGGGGNASRTKITQGVLEDLVKSAGSQALEQALREYSDILPESQQYINEAITAEIGARSAENVQKDLGGRNFDLSTIGGGGDPRQTVQRFREPKWEDFAPTGEPASHASQMPAAREAFAEAVKAWEKENANLDDTPLGQVLKDSIATKRAAADEIYAPMAQAFQGQVPLSSFVSGESLIPAASSLVSDPALQAIFADVGDYNITNDQSLGMALDAFRPQAPTRDEYFQFVNSPEFLSQPPYVREQMMAEAEQAFRDATNSVLGQAPDPEVAYSTWRAANTLGMVREAERLWEDTDIDQYRLESALNVALENAGSYGEYKGEDSLSQFWEEQGAKSEPESINLDAARSDITADYNKDADLADQRIAAEVTKAYGIQPEDLGFVYPEEVEQWNSQNGDPLGIAIQLGSELNEEGPSVQTMEQRIYGKIMDNDVLGPLATADATLMRVFRKAIESIAG